MFLFDCKGVLTSLRSPGDPRLSVPRDSRLIFMLGASGFLAVPVFFAGGELDF